MTDKFKTTTPLDTRRVQILGPDGTPASTSNRFPVDSETSHGKTVLAATGTDNTAASHELVAAPGAGIQIYVQAYFIAHVGGTLQLGTFEDGDGADLWAVPMRAPADVLGGANLAVSAPAYLFSCPANKALKLVLSVAELTYWSVSYWKE